MSSFYGICVGIALVVSWQAFQWLAQRLTFDTKTGAVLGRSITSVILGAVLSFILSGLFLEFVTSGLGGVGGKQLSSFAAAVFGGIFGAIWGLVWGLVRGFRDARAIADSDSKPQIFPSWPSWLVPVLLLGIAVYSIGLSYQTQPVNVFGQVCERAYSNLQRVGQACFKPEWLAIGIVLGVMAGLSWRSGKQVRRLSETDKGQEK